MKKEKLLYAERIREAIQETGLSFKKAAERAGIPEKTLRKWVQRVAIPGIDQFSNLVVKLGINPFYVLTGEGPPLLPHDRRKNFFLGQIVSSEDEEILRERHRHLVSLLEGKKKTPEEESVFRVFWGLVLNRPPLPEDLGVVCRLYGENPEEFLARIRKDWEMNPEIPVSPTKELRIAVMDLLDLYRKNLLPSFCPVHGKAFWTECPVCRKLQKK